MKNLETIWTEAAAQGETLKEYPRPGMKRKHWINLNGMWDYLITQRWNRRPYLQNALQSGRELRYYENLSASFPLSMQPQP